MRKGKTLLRRAGVLVATALVGACGLCSLSMAQSQCELSGEQRADLIEIGSMERFGTLQLPKVVFLHDAHTAALIAAGQDCSTCHEITDGVVSPFYKGTTGDNASVVQDVFHDSCMSCHDAYAEQGKPTGPQDGECRSCHDGAPIFENARKKVFFSKEAHYAHTSSASIKASDGADKNCNVCHEMVDNEAGKLVWFANQSSAKMASHQGCISCHQAVTAQNATAETGPITCTGCHDPVAPLTLHVEEVPRLMNGQPDTTLILPRPAADKPQNMKGTFPPVPFDHKLHEAAANSCNTCHEPSFMTGANGEQFKPQAPLAAMDLCINCHAEEVKKPECAGCHAAMPALKFEDTNCYVCHVAVPNYTVEETQSGSLLTASQEELSALATEMLAEQKPVAPYDLNDIPDMVLIDSIANEYEGSEFPHRKIVKAIFDGTANSKLAATFHTEKGTLCQGCHHNSPASLNPPKCGSCHTAAAAAHSDRPDLKAAFHMQCMGCHDSMNVTKPANTDCAGCHKPAN